MIIQDNILLVNENGKIILLEIIGSVVVVVGGGGGGGGGGDGGGYYPFPPSSDGPGRIIGQAIFMIMISLNLVFRS